MNLPQEIEVWYVVPLIRKLLVFDLKKRGLKQNEIARLLKLTESAVSQYIKEKRAKDYDISIPEDVQTFVVKAVDKIISEDGNNHVAVKQINFLCGLFREKKIICQVHRKIDPDFEDCAVCYET